MKGSRFFALLLGMPLLVWQLLFFLLSFVFLVALSFWLVKNFQITPDFSFKNWHWVITRDIFWEAYGKTLLLAFSNAIITSLVAFPVSYMISFKLNDRARRWIIFILVLPFFTSYLVRVYTMQVFLLDNGIINIILGSLFGATPQMLNNVFGTMVGYMTLCLPLVILLQTFGLNFIDRDLIGAAHNLRCGRFAVIYRVILPSARVAFVIAGLFAFILTFGDFVSPLYLGGGNPPTLSIMITDITKSGQQWPRAAVVALIMVATLLTVAFGAIKYAYHKVGKNA